MNEYLNQLDKYVHLLNEISFHNHVVKIKHHNNLVPFIENKEFCVLFVSYYNKVGTSTAFLVIQMIFISIKHLN